MSLIKRIRPLVLPVYPFLLGLYPVLYLWSANRAQQPAYVVIPSLIETLAVLLVLFLGVWIISRNVHRAALWTSILSFFALTFGHFVNLVGSWKRDLAPTDLLPAFVLLTLALLLLVVVQRIGSPLLTRTINLVSGGLILFQLVSAAPYYLSMTRYNQASVLGAAPGKSIPTTGTSPQRDVYFILLDNYGRQDILQEGSDFDNSDLVAALEERGFQFTDCPQGNYMSTAPVVASILNMDYLDELKIQEKSYIKRGGYEDMAPLIQDSLVLQKFKAYGYHTVTFRGFMGLIDIQNADTYINFEKETSYIQRLETTKFQDLYLNTTIFPSLQEKFKIDLNSLLAKGPDFLKPAPKKPTSQDLLEPQFYQVYQQNLYAFDALERIPSEIEGPKFVYAHIYSVHWPFMLKPDGSLRLPFTQKITKEGYVDALQYTNERILTAIDSILANSENEPIIILQGDHANHWVDPVEWSGKDRLKILSAYYLPDGGEEQLYDTISPVNNFRLIFSYYFKEPIELLPDVYHYLSPVTRKLQTTSKTCISDSLP